MRQISPSLTTISICPKAATCRTECVKVRIPDAHTLGQDITDPRAIYAAAFIFLDRFGEDAQNQADIRAHELLTAEDFQGRVRWQLISKAIKTVLEQTEHKKIELN